MNPDSFRSRLHRPRARGFSLMEMLVVLAVIAMIAGFAVPAFTEMLKGSKLRQAADLVRNQLVLAQQTAIKNGTIVVVQFYQYDDQLVPGPEREFRAMQVLERDGVLKAATPGASSTDPESYFELRSVTKILRLPDGVIFSDDPQYSTILSSVHNTNRRSNWRRMPRSMSEDAAEVIYMEFRPDGSTTLDPAKASGWFLTLYDEVAGFTSNSSLPANFVTLQIDPLNGNVREYQPY